MSEIRPVLKKVYSPDVYNLDEYLPDNPQCFSVFIQAMFGPEGSEGEESFDIVVCSPGWLAKKAAKEGVVNARHHLVVNEFDMRKIRTFLDQYASDCAEKNWHEAALKLSRLGHWEFEDYQS